MIIRYAVLCAAIWFTAFAMGHVVQFLVMSVPDALQARISFGWAVQATVLAPVFAGLQMTAERLNREP